MEIRYSKESIKFLKRLDTIRSKQIVTAIAGLTKTPPVGDIKPMQGVTGEYRLRVGKYRVIYGHSQEQALVVLNIIRIGSRGDIYK